ncbi:MAG: DUF2520 domain-containing protein [Balneolaceae bacterium]|nr:MAG: DUF2520 domain-containing protein [Balneolaceae bacterium]
MTPFESSRQQFPRGFTIIGTGRLGSSLALRLHSKGYQIRSLYNRSLESCERIASLTETEIFGTFPARPADLGDVVFLCLPDDQIAAFAKKMGVVKDGPAWVHTSGATPADVLLPLAPDGSGIASMHPVQTFTSRNRDSAFNQCFVTLQGDPELCVPLKKVVQAIGGRPLMVDSRQKTAIHLAAVYVCNYMAPLFAASQDLLDDHGLEVRARDLFGPMVRQALDGLLNHPPAEVLTGPVLRGDTGTVDRHLQVLAGSPKWDHLYRALGKATLELAQTLENRNHAADDEMMKRFSGA